MQAQAGARHRGRACSTDQESCTQDMLKFQVPHSVTTLNIPDAMQMPAPQAVQDARDRAEHGCWAQRFVSQPLQDCEHDLLSVGGGI